MSGFARAAVMRNVAAGIAANAERLARLDVNDSGKLLREMIGQLNALPQWYYYFAGLADKLEGRTIPPVNQNYFCYTRREPVGVVGAITPWNSPLLLLTHKLAPLLAAGNTCVVKPSEHAPASTVAFAEVLFEAGLPAGVLNVVTGWDRGTGEALASHKGIDKVAFTGSSDTGARVAQAASANLNRVTLELGGKSPQIVFADADLDAAANGLVAGVFAATGQTCMAGSRLIVHADVHDALIERSWHARTRSSSVTRRFRRPKWVPLPTSPSTKRSSVTSREPSTRAPSWHAVARPTQNMAACSSSRLWSRT
jgi:acyl-CoA reductase-like NAD-dependent aldehyde dehydrogenase